MLPPSMLSILYGNNTHFLSCTSKYVVIVREAVPITKSTSRIMRGPSGVYYGIGFAIPPFIGEREKEIFEGCIIF